MQLNFWLSRSAKQHQNPCSSPSLCSLFWVHALISLFKKASFSTLLVIHWVHWEILVLLCRHYYNNRRCLENYFILMMLFAWTKYNCKFIERHQKLSGRFPISKAVPRLDYQLFGVSTIFSHKTQGRYKLDSLKWQEIQPRLCLEKIIPTPSIMIVLCKN